MLKGGKIGKLIEGYKAGKITPEKRFDEVVKESQDHWGGLTKEQ